MAEKVIKLGMIKPIKHLLLADSFIKVAYGGRGSGKSYGIAAILVAKALESPRKILCARETQNSISDSSLGVIKRVISETGLDGMFHQTKHTLKCVNGSEFLFRGMQQPHRIKSIEDISIAWIDEADSISPESWKILLPTIRREDAEVWVSFNPQLKSDFVYQEFVLKDSPLIAKQLVNYTDNPYISGTLREQIDLMRRDDYDKYEHIYLGHPIENDEAQIFKYKYKIVSKGLFESDWNDLDDSTRHCLPKWHKPSDGIYRIGVDFGYSNDPTAIIRTWITDDNELVIDREIFKYGMELDEIPAAIRSIDGWEHALIYADSSRPETISYINTKLGGANTVRKAKKPKGSIIEGIERIKGFNQVYILSDLKHTIDEFKLYSFVKDKRSGEITNIPEDKNNHCIDSIRYALNLVDKEAVARIEFIDGFEKLSY